MTALLHCSVVLACTTSSMAFRSTVMLALLISFVLCSALSVNALWPLPPIPSPSESSLPVPATPIPIVGPYRPPNCAAPPLAGTIVCDESQPLSTRVSSFVASLTTAEKVQSLSFSWSAIDRVGLPGYIVINEGLHGVVFSGAAAGQPCSNGTQFPQTILSSASFDRDIIRSYGQPPSATEQQRALSNSGLHEPGHPLPSDQPRQRPPLGQRTGDPRARTRTTSASSAPPSHRDWSAGTTPAIRRSCP